MIYLNAIDAKYTFILLSHDFSIRNIKINSHIDFQINASLVKSIICKNIEKYQKNMNKIQIYEAFS